MGLLSNYVKTEVHPLPVFLMVDVSGSMRGEKIETVNACLKEMINSFKKIPNPKGVIHLCIMTFGNSEIKIIRELGPLKDDESYTLSANGNTPMGACFDKLSEMVESYDVMSGKSYTPTFILISDGNPTDFRCENLSLEEILNWESLKKIHFGSRASKGKRTAVGIGGDQNIDVLKAFINDDTIPVIKPIGVEGITRYFEWITMSVSVRSVSNNPQNSQFADLDDYFKEDEMEF